MVRKFILCVLYISLPLLAAFATVVVLRHVTLNPMNVDNNEILTFEVPDHATFGQVARELQEKGIIRYDWAFKLLAKIKRKDTSIMSGEYELSPSMPPMEILDRMVTGKMVQRRFTVKEGSSIWEIGPLLAKVGIIPRVEFEAGLTNPNFLKELKIPAPSFEGYLFPQTYQFPRGTKAKKILSTMIDQLNANWELEWDARLAELGMTKHEILTLASIVEKESGDAEEQPMIASVFTNRLKKKMRLQADPTVIYGVPNFNGNLTKEDLLTHTPYNTYVVDGLPPGPIANPGESAIRAALYSAQSDNLYFVANGQGRHIFSSTLAEHNEAVLRYQKNPAKKGSTVQDSKE